MLFKDRDCVVAHLLIIYIAQVLYSDVNETQYAKLVPQRAAVMTKHHIKPSDTRLLSLSHQSAVKRLFQRSQHGSLK